MILALNLTLMKLFVLIGLLLPFSLLSQLSIQSISVENQSNPIGIGVSAPRFSWKLSSLSRNESQSAIPFKYLQVRSRFGIVEKLIPLPPYLYPMRVKNYKVIQLILRKFRFGIG